MSAPPRRAWAVGAMAFGLGTPVSYAGQRLLAWLLLDQDPSMIVSQVHTPFTWRLFLAALHGVLVGLILAVGLSDDRAGKVLAIGPWIVTVVIVPFALSMVLVP